MQGSMSFNVDPFLSAMASNSEASVPKLSIKRAVTLQSPDDAPSDDGAPSKVRRSEAQVRSSASDPLHGNDLKLAAVTTRTVGTQTGGENPNSEETEGDCTVCAAPVVGATLHSLFKQSFGPSGVVSLGSSSNKVLQL